MNTEEKFRLIKRNTQEIVEEKELKELLKKKKNPTAYVGYAPTGLLHIGHLVPLLKIADFLRAGFKFTFLVADIHAYLDDKKSSWEQLAFRAKVYEELAKSAIKSLGVDPKNIKFVKGSDFQLEKDYQLDVLRFAGEVTFARVKRAASEVVRFGDAPKLGGFIYPLMQIEDITALNADVAFGGVDQRGIYMLGREVFPAVGRKKPTCVFGPLLPSLSGGKMGGKMSASAGSSTKISLLDSEKDISKKINSAFCVTGKVEENGLLELIKLVIMPRLKDASKKFIIKRPEKFGGNIEFGNYRQLEQAFADKQLHPMDLKKAVARELNDILAPVRKHFSSQKMKNLLKKAGY